MNNNPKTKSIQAMAEKFLKSIGFGIVNKQVNAADETVLDFFELEEDDVVATGAKVRVDNDDKVTKDFVMKSGETYKVVDGVLAEIVAKEDDAPNEEAVALQKEIDTLTKQLAAMNTAAESYKAKAETAEAMNVSKDAIIAKYQASGSQPAPNDPKPAPNQNTVTETKNAVIDNAIKNLKKL
jgi:hypothetical protein